MIRIMGFKKTEVVIFVIVLFLVSSIVVVSGQPIQNIPSKQNVIFTHEVNHPVWDVEYDLGLVAYRVATDSMNNVILVGTGGHTDTELPYGVIVKYGANSKLKWSDNRYAPIIPGLISKAFVIINSVSQVHKITNSISQSIEIISMKQTSKANIIPTCTQSSIDYKTLPCEESSNTINEFIMSGHQYLGTNFTKNQFLLGGKWVRFYDVAVDSNDNIIVVGEIQNRNTKDLRTMYIIKYDPDGNVLWDRVYKRYGLNPRDMATGVALDSNNNIFVTIRSQEKDSENFKGWILKLSPNKGAKISESIHPGDSIIFSDIVVDSEDNVYVSANYPASEKMTVVKYSNDLTLLDEWGPAVRPIRPNAINVDQNGNVIVAGGIGFFGSEKQYIAKYSPDGTMLWSNKSTDIGVWYDVVALSPDVTAVTGISWGNEMYGRFYVGLYNESGKEFKRFLGGSKTNLQCFFSHGLDIDNNGDIAVAGFRWYGTALYYMHGIKFYQ